MKYGQQLKESDKDNFKCLQFKDYIEEINNDILDLNISNEVLLSQFNDSCIINNYYGHDDYTQVDSYSERTPENILEDYFPIDTYNYLSGKIGRYLILYPLLKSYINNYNELNDLDKENIEIYIECFNSFINEKASELFKDVKQIDIKSINKTETKKGT